MTYYSMLLRMNCTRCNRVVESVVKLLKISSFNFDPNHFEPRDANKGVWGVAPLKIPAPGLGRYLVGIENRS